MWYAVQSRENYIILIKTKRPWLYRNKDEKTILKLAENDEDYEIFEGVDIGDLWAEIESRSMKLLWEYIKKSRVTIDDGGLIGGNKAFITVVAELPDDVVKKIERYDSMFYYDVL